MAKEIETSGKVHKIIINFVRLLLVVAFFGALRNDRPLVLFISILAFFVTFLPVILKRKWGVKIPAGFEVTVPLPTIETERMQSRSVGQVEPPPPVAT